MSDTIAAVSTGFQISAIGIIRLSGDDAINIIDRVFTPASGASISQRRDRELVYGRLHTAEGDTLDLCLCTVSRAPHSYTGENTAELQCHGSPVVLRAALEELFRLGARQADPGEFTKRAFLNGRMELTEAEAVADLIDAETVECAKNAAGQLSGAISRKLDGIYDLLVDICSHYHAVLDYPDEDIEDFRLDSYRADLTGCIDRLRALKSTYSRGKLMVSGIPAAIIGRPNAGKSSLLNALLGYDRAIVTSVPGTTRDTIEEKLRLGRVCIRLIDTAGIRDTDDEVERLGVERSRRALENAELVIAVVDGSEKPNDDDMQMIALAEKAPKAVVAVAKSDLGKVNTPETTLPTVTVSSVTGEGIDELEEIISGLFCAPDVPAGEILTNARQENAVSRALEYMCAVKDAMDCGMTPDAVLTEAEGAMNALGELDGRTVREDVTNRIFQRFCVGK